MYLYNIYTPKEKKSTLLPSFQERMQYDKLDWYASIDTEFTSSSFCLGFNRLEHFGYKL